MCPPLGSDETIMAYKMPLGGGIHRISSGSALLPECEITHQLPGRAQCLAVTGHVFQPGNITPIAGGCLQETGQPCRGCLGIRRAQGDMQAEGGQPGQLVIFGQGRVERPWIGLDIIRIGQAQMLEHEAAIDRRQGQRRGQVRGQCGGWPGLIRAEDQHGGRRCQCLADLLVETPQRRTAEPVIAIGVKQQQVAAPGSGLVGVPGDPASGIRPAGSPARADRQVRRAPRGPCR